MQSTGLKHGKGERVVGYVAIGHMVALLSCAGTFVAIGLLVMSTVGWTCPGTRARG